MSLLFLALLVPGILATTGCDKFDRFRTKEGRKNKYMNDGKKFMADGKSREAMQRFALAIRTDPNWAEAQYQFGLASLRSRDYARAFKAFQSAVEKDPKHYGATSELASIYLVMKRYEDARGYADKMLVIKPHDARAQEIIAYSMAGLGDMEGSEKELEALVQEDPTQISADINLVRMKLHDKDLAGAEAILKHATEAKSPSMQNWILLGNFYLMTRKVADSEQAYRKAITVDPKNPDPQYALGRLLALTNKNQEAEQVYGKIAADNPGVERHRSALARFHLARGPVDKGIAELEEIVKKYPDDKANRNLLTATLVRAGKTDRAMALANDQLQRNPKDIAGLLTRGVLYVRQQKTQEAITDLTQVLRFQVDNADAHYFMAMARMQHQERLPATQELQDALKYKPNFLRARLALAQLQLDSGSPQTALEILSVAPKPQDQAPAVIMLKAASLIRKGQSAEAEAMLSDLLKTKPNLSAVQTQLGMLLGEKKDYKGAQQAFEKALTVDKYDARAALGLAICYRASNQLATGEKVFEKMVAAEPRFGPAVFGLVDTRIALKKDAQAEKDLQAYSVLAPKDPGAIRRLAQIRYDKQDFAGAEDYYRRALVLAPQSTQFMVELGMVLEKEKRIPDAMNSYREALKIRADDPIAANNLAWLLCENGGNIDEALKWAQMGKEKAPNDAAVIDTLGWIYMKKNNSSLAISEFRDATTKEPKNPLYLYHLGVAQYRAGDTRQAEVSMKTALDAKTDFPGIDDARKTLKDIQGIKR